MSNQLKLNTMEQIEITKDLEREMGVIEIPTISNYDRFEREQENAWANGLERCPCCGKGIKNGKYYINTCWGGSAFKAEYEVNKYSDSWAMQVGSECRKKFPEGYVWESKK